MKRPIISVHIPKTAGTTIRTVFDTIFGPEHIVIDVPERGVYLASNDNYSYKKRELSSKMKRFLRKLPLSKYMFRLLNNMRFRPKLVTEIPKDIAVIHGHFPLSKYIQKFPNALCITILREPLERMISHYSYWKKLHSEMRKLPEWFDADMTFEEFALHPKMRNFMSKYLEPKKLEDYDMVGVQDDIASYVKKLIALTGFSGNIPVQVVNKNVEKHEHHLSDMFKKKFRKFHALDYNNYELAKELSKK